MSRLKYIKRWGLMRNTTEENTAEHTFDVAIITHALCIIKNKQFGGSINCGEAVLFALYHDAGEAITGDLPTPVKYFDDDIKTAYKKIEAHAEQTMAEMLPDGMKEEISPYIMGKASGEIKKIVRAADKICAYIKCIEEKKSGNTEFEKAAANILQTIDAMQMPETDYFMREFIDGYLLTLDELN